MKTFNNGHTPIREGYAPATAMVTCEPVVIQGQVDREDISTSLIERQNCTARNYVKRLARLTLAFSKKLEGLVAALCLHFCWYNFGRIHGSLRCTPAMAAGIARRPWKVADLVPAD
ncbi:MAG TPA: hypothetical protein VN999_14675 [Thermoanaerobaculia bacterium]|nr:hypothetical protein [Thermoanaerobaculia bacterium]